MENTNVQMTPEQKIAKRKKIAVILIFSMVAVLVFYGFYFQSTKAAVTNDVASFEELNKELPTILYFNSKTCQYCKKVTPALSAIKTQYGDKINVYSLDVQDGGEGEKFYKNYAVNSVPGRLGVPTLIYLDTNGDEVSRDVGYGGTYNKNSYDYILNKITKRGWIA